MTRPRPLSIQWLREQQGGSSPADALAAAARQRLEAEDGRLHAVRHLYDEPDRGAADGPLAGIPYLTKANIAVAGRPLDCASRILQGYLSPYDATVTERLRAAGAWLVGATNMDEFGMGSSTEHSCDGPTRNPFDRTRTPGGSSGGSAAAVAAGWVPFALGSDTGGSVRQPAAFCGLVGLRPTYGRISRHGLVAFASSLDQIGPLARSVDDVAEVFWILAGVDPHDMTTVEPAHEPENELPATPRLGVPRSLLAMASSAVRDHFGRCEASLVEAGFELVEVELPASRRATEIYTVLAAAEASSNLARFDGLLYGRRVEADSWEETVRRSRSEGFGVEVQRRILGGVHVLAAEHRARFHDRAQSARQRVREEHRRALEGCEALLLPTAPTLPFRLGEALDDPVRMYGCDVFTTAASLAGLPALALPSGASDDGLPHSLQLVGPPFGEGRLFELGRRLEQLFEVGRLQREVFRLDDRGEFVVSLPRCAIGLEVHVQLNTRTKLFSSSSVEFDAEVNTRVDPHCLGLPGTLPTLQRAAVDKALRLALALGAKVAPVSCFDRKNYFYPDLPRNYQITQQRVPLATGGALGGMGGEGPFTLQRLHLEEDAGRSKRQDTQRLVDLNRAGTPLAEIVTPPTLEQPEEAGVFLTALRDLVRWLDVGDGNMEEGSLRCDANLSLRDQRSGEPGPRVEIKNLNSIKAVVAALHGERRRQALMREKGEIVTSQTRGFDADRGESVFLRGKESLEDYRYFPDPDLPPLVVDTAWIERATGALGELPWQCRARLAGTHGLDEETVREVTRSPAAADYFEAVAERVEGQLAARWIRGELREHSKARGLDTDAPAVPAPALAELLELLTAGRLSHSLAKEVLAEMVDADRTAAAILAERDLEVLNDPKALGDLVDAVLAAHPAQVETYRAGKHGLLGFFMGQAMRRSQGRADAPALRRLFLERLER